MRDGPVTELHWLGVAEAAERDRGKGPLAGRAHESPARPHCRARSAAQRLHPSRRRGRHAGRQGRRSRSDRGPAARAAARRAGRHQGHHRCRRPADDRPFQDPAGQPRDRRCRLRRKAARRRRHRGRQALDPRVRHRRAELRPAVAAGAQSVEHRPSSRRLVVGLGLGRVGRPVPDGAGQRHRRQRAQSGELLRHRRPQADLRSGVAARRLPALLHPRPYRADDAHGRRQCADAGGDRRPRPAGSRQRGRAERPLCGRRRALRARPARGLHPPFPRNRRAGRARGHGRARACRPHPAARGRRGARRPSADLGRVRRGQSRHPAKRGLGDPRSLAARAARRLRPARPPPPDGGRLLHRRRLRAGAAPPAADDRRGRGGAARARCAAVRQLDGSGLPHRPSGRHRAHLSAPGPHALQRHRPSRACHDGRVVSGRPAACRCSSSAAISTRRRCSRWRAPGSRRPASTRSIRRSCKGCHSSDPSLVIQATCRACSSNACPADRVA